MYVYGPVPSRRLGSSLGISLTPHKICNFDCIYCQLGRTTKKSSERKEFVSKQAILAELRQWLHSHPQQAKQLHYITFSGTGEPTLHLAIGALISEIKKITDVPVAVITNASLFSDPELRKELLGADLLIPSLDAVQEDIFNRIDRPHPGIVLGSIIEGLIALRKEFRGEIWLEVMLVKGVNDDLGHIRKLKEVIERIRPDKIQLNSPVRVPAEPDVFPVDSQRLAEIKAILGAKCEVA